MTELGAEGVGLVVGWALALRTRRPAALAAVGCVAAAGVGLLHGAAAAVAAGAACLVGVAACAGLQLAVERAMRS